MPADARSLVQRALAVPRYLLDTYWWAYVHPSAVALLDRPWVVNLILWGNFPRLRDAALDAMAERAGSRFGGRTLQVACVYGDLTARLVERLEPGSRVDVIDVLPVQLDNLARKLPPPAPVDLWLADSAAIRTGDARFDRALLFFLLHEQPDAVRRATLAEALRVVRPGGRIVVVDYHGPHRLHPLRYLMRPLLAVLEPFALDLWRREIGSWLPAGRARLLSKQTYFGGLYQRLVFAV
ncbi:MAG TPA: rhodoquinone biosynthesis methyltransferase RquA [Burkholderiaceae bacterium]